MRKSVGTISLGLAIIFCLSAVACDGEPSVKSVGGAGNGTDMKISTLEDMDELLYSASAKMAVKDSQTDSDSSSTDVKGEFASLTIEGEYELKTEFILGGMRFQKSTFAAYFTEAVSYYIVQGSFEMGDVGSATGQVAYACYDVHIYISEEKIAVKFNEYYLAEVRNGEKTIVEEILPSKKGIWVEVSSTKEMEEIRQDLKDYTRIEEYRTCIEEGLKAEEGGVSFSKDGDRYTLTDDSGDLTFDLSKREKPSVFLALDATAEEDGAYVYHELNFSNIGNTVIYDEIQVGYICKDLDDLWGEPT